MKKTGTEVHGRLLARNTILNLAGMLLPLAVGVVAIPVVVGRLGPERFGILALAWMILGYFGMLDLGTGRATTKFVSQYSSQGDDERIAAFVWTAASFQFILGAVIGLALALSGPLVVERVLAVDSGLHRETVRSFILISFAVPAVMVSGSFRGALEAYQRFDLVNAVKAPFSAANFLLPLAGVSLGWGLVPIVLLLVAARWISMAFTLAMAARGLPVALTFVSPSRSALRLLLGYGGWVTLAQLTVPVFVYLDRFLVGALAGIGALTYYSVPYEAVSRLLIIPLSLVSVLFPAFSVLSAGGKSEKLAASVTRSLKYLVSTMVPPALVFLLFAEEILRVWLGSDFAGESTMVLRLLSVAILLNAIGYIPYGLAQGAGRPEVVALYHLAELPVYAAVAVFLIGRFGIDGAALAWLLRMGVTIPIFTLICCRAAGVPPGAFREGGTLRSLTAGAAVIVLGALLLAGPFAGGGNTALKAAAAAALLLGYGAVVWYHTFDSLDRELFTRFFRRRHE